MGSFAPDHPRKRRVLGEVHDASPGHGRCGFIGSNLVRWLRRHRPGWTVVNLDKLTYAGNLENLADLEGTRGTLRPGRHREPGAGGPPPAPPPVEAVLHLAAESHVDRSILGPEAFVATNVLGTAVLLEAARQAKVGRFLMVSTDEVWPAGDPPACSPRAPPRPLLALLASKASADLLSLAYEHTFGLDVVVTRCSNNYGPFQFPRS